MLWLTLDGLRVMAKDTRRDILLFITGVIIPSSDKDLVRLPSSMIVPFGSLPGIPEIGFAFKLSPPFFIPMAEVCVEGGYESSCLGDSKGNIAM